MISDCLSASLYHCLITRQRPATSLFAIYNNWGISISWTKRMNLFPVLYYGRCRLSRTISMCYWPSVRSRWLDIGQVLFLRVYGPRRSRGPKTRKKITRPIFSHLDRTNLVNKGFIIWLLVKFCLRDTAGSPERARWLHLACSGSQSQRAIWFILPAHGASHVINMGYWPSVRSRWLDIAQVLFLHVYGPRLRLGP